MNTVDTKTLVDKGNDPAYPTLLYDEPSGRPNSHRLGLTKREMFAMAAMQGIVSGFTHENKANGCYIPSYEYAGLMSQAVQLADELLKQLES